MLPVADAFKLTILLIESSILLPAPRARERHGADASRHDQDQRLPLSPPLYRIESGDMAAASRHVTACVEKEFDLQRLTSIHSWLWVSGLPMPPSSLYQQLLLGHDIFGTECMDMHLVGTTGRRSEYLSRGGECGCSGHEVAAQGYTQECTRGLRKRALGFLFSDAALISHESDFRTAKEKHLLPLQGYMPRWNQYSDFVRDNFAMLLNSALI
ncbi:hypothetical protein B0T10DRAFT_98751 [Thelonectria olida]|uniref:Uncharacterized protein n=1 Tax=Thelonectria olida TaxID=1576542 RepID=A0A9P8VY84_9HYPO|nr:hypothetical protein B0T10DRAFT_98751 [Thelonectria olida]